MSKAWVESLLIFIGRLIMSALFLGGAYWHVTNWQSALQKTSAAGAPYPEAFLLLATLFLTLGGLSLLFGYLIRLGVLLLVIEIIPTTVLFYPFWAMKGPEMQLTLLAFLKSLALCSGLIFLLYSGPGSVSIKK